MKRGVSRADSSQGEPADFQLGAQEGREAREAVAAAILGNDLTGSPEYVSRRVRDVVEAERSKDPMVRYAAAIELSAAAAAYAAAIRLEAPWIWNGEKGRTAETFTAGVQARLDAAA